MKKKLLSFICVLLSATFVLNAKVTCNICSYSVKQFKDFGADVRKNACCQNCKSLERQRHLWYFLHTQKKSFFDKPRTVLHWAPKDCLEKYFNKVPKITYLKRDLYSKNGNSSAMLDYDDKSIDVVIASHVLDSIPDDKRAIEEIYRVLKPGGYALLISPLFDHIFDTTNEDITITNSKEQEKYFGESHRVRNYVSSDFEERLTGAGFSVTCFPVQKLPEEIIQKYALYSTNYTQEHTGSDIYLCKKGYGCCFLGLLCSILPCC